MKTKISSTTNSTTGPLLWRNQYAARPVFNPVVDVMSRGTAYLTWRSGSLARAVAIQPSPRRRKRTGKLWGISRLSVLVSVALLFSSQLALAQFSQQSRLVGTGVAGIESEQGTSVSVSSNGNTVIVGGPGGFPPTGAAWVYTRTGDSWTQQGFKLIGTGAIGNAQQQGYSVSLSSDGNTAIVGGPSDDGGKGAVWVYTRTGSVWTQQSKLIGTGASGNAQQGTSVSLSSDGNTLIVGGPFDDGEKGAVWIYTRTGSVWTQQSKLVGTGASGNAQQGTSVSLSSDGNTVIVGGPFDDGEKGAAWVYTRSGDSWTSQGKLVGTGASGNVTARQGASVSLSSDGDTAIVGGPYDGEYKGAAWVYTRSGGVWTQEGSKLVGKEGIGNAQQQGKAVSLSADGNTAVAGGPRDDYSKGAAWVYVRQIQRADLPWWAKYVAIDPMALILKGKALDIWFEIQHPHEPKVAEIQRVLRSMTPEEQKAALNRARMLEIYAKSEAKRIRSMPPEEQKTALNRVRTLENYGKAVEKAFATMKQ